MSTMSPSNAPVFFKRLLSFNKQFILFIFFAGLSLLFFGDVLFFSPFQVLSLKGADLSSYFIYAREFGFTELASGNLPLWNPHMYAGQPYVGGLQSALFYPINWVYLFLPLQKAINLDFTLHVFFGGFFMACWAARRGTGVFASVTGGVIFMFSGAFFPHVYAGHLAPLGAMAWLPLIFLSLDMIMEKPGLKAWALGVFALSMQFLPGYPQMVYFGGVAAGLYVLLHLATKKLSPKALGLMAAMGIFTIGLCAVQFLSSLEMGRQSLRTGGLDYEYASMFSFPMENFLTLLAPGFFGVDGAVPYWGRWFFWEMCVYTGVIGLFLAFAGLIYAQRRTRLYAGMCLAACLLLGMGAYTPLYHFLHAYFPGFNMFRGQSKFIICAALFFSLLAGAGLDALLKGEVRHIRRLAGLLLGAGVACAAFGYCLQISAGSEGGGWWRAFFLHVQNTGQSYLSADMRNNAEFIYEAGSHAAKGLYISGALLIGGGALLFFSRMSQKTIYCLGILAMAEMVVFAHGIRGGFDIRETRFQELAEFGQTLSPEVRVHNQSSPNSGIAHGLQDVWGYDPFILKRYAEYIYASQGKNPDNASYTMQFEKYNKMIRMLRCRYIIGYKGSECNIIDAGAVLPRALIVGGVQEAAGRDGVFEAIQAQDFDPASQVVLESPPPFQVDKQARGTVSVRDLDTDTMIIRAETNAPQSCS